jgi:type IV secretory pathway TraG/TraD family ATPase VirD4
VLGGTGSGKTSLCLVPLIIQLIAQGDSSIVVFDMKGDGFLFWTTFIEAARAGLPFRWVTIEPGAASFAFNPFTQLHNQKRSVNARAQSLLVSLGLYYGEAYGKTFFQSITLDTLTAFLTKFRDIRSFADLAKYAEARASYTATNTDQENSQHLRMLLRQLAAIEPLNVTSEAPVRPEVLRDAIDMTDVLTRKQVVFFSLPSLEEELTAKSVSKLGLYSLVHAAKILNRTSKSLPCYTFVDEFQQVCAENIKILLEMARSMGIYLVLSHQDISQLKTADYDITSTVESCTTFKLSFEASSLAALTQMEEYSGETRERTLSWTQPIHAGFDEDNDDALSSDRAYPKSEFEVPTVNVVEHERSTLTKNEILAVSAHPLRGFVRSRSDSGLTQYRGQWMAIECEYCTTQKEYETRSKTPLPSQHPSCVTVGTGHGDDESDPGPSLPNNPLPVTPPPSSVDGAIADRLQELQDRIRTEHLEKTK